MNRPRRQICGIATLVLTFAGFGATSCGSGGGSTANTPATPVAAFSGGVRIGQAPFEVQFIDESQGVVREWLWDFGDGGTSTEEQPTHTYENAGLYDVSLTVTGDNGSNTLMRANIVAVESFPVAGSDSGDRSLAAHALRRMANGPTPSELNAVTDMGVAAYVEQQLDPAGIPETEEFTALMERWPRPRTLFEGSVYADLERATIARHIYSKRQLLEQLTLFWEYHFNTNFANATVYFESMESATYLEWREDDLFQRNALGRFEDLLMASATSPAMIGYLHSFLNEKSAPNENYARELLELHTMGVDNGYTELDVEQVARCFTGWGFCTVLESDESDPHAPCVEQGPGATWAFHFYPDLHDNEPKTIFAGTSYELFLPATSGQDGLRDGLTLLTHLAGLPNTAEYVSSKLIAKFVDDEPPTELVERCVAKWLATGGDVREVMRTILHSEFFRGEASRWTKMRTPLEGLAAQMRATGAVIRDDRGFDALRSSLHGALNQRIYYWLSPDGYPETWREQFGTTKLLHYVLGLQASHSGDVGIEFDLPALASAAGFAGDDAEGIVDFFFDTQFAENFTESDRQRALTFLTTDDFGVESELDPLAENYEARLGLFATFLGSFPQNLLQ